MRLLLSILLILGGCNLAAAQTAKVQVLFPFNSAELTDSATKIIDSFTAILAGKKITRFVIEAHCDQVGDEFYNDKLSMERVHAVLDHFKRSISFKDVMVSYHGKGERELISQNWDEASRQLNRRADIIVDYEAKATAQTPDKPNNLITAITDTAVKTGETIILKDLHFYGGRHYLLPQSHEALYELLDAMQRLPKLKIEIQGHICCGRAAPDQYDGYDGYDIDTREYKLSLNRARGIYNFLRDNGISTDRMTYKGFGYQQPIITPEITEADRTTNRRVVIKILAK